MISLKNETPLDHSHSKHLSQIKYAENVHTKLCQKRSQGPT